MKNGKCIRLNKKRRLNTVVPIIEDDDVVVDFDAIVTAPAHPEPAPEPDRVAIVRRWPQGVLWSALITTMREVRQSDSPVPIRARDISSIQLAWRRYYDNVQCSETLLTCILEIFSSYAHLVT